MYVWTERERERVMCVQDRTTCGENDSVLLGVDRDTRYKIEVNKLDAARC